MIIKIGGDNEYILTKHAMHRMKKRNVALEDLQEALKNPKRITSLLDSHEGKRTSILGNNKLFIIINPDSKVIITVFRYTHEYYAAKNKRRRNKNERVFKSIYGNRYRDKKRQLTSKKG